MRFMMLLIQVTIYPSDNQIVMEENYDTLIEILESSVKKNGERPLTNKWLLNILRKASKETAKTGCEDIYPFDPNFDQ